MAESTVSSDLLNTSARSSGSHSIADLDEFVYAEENIVARHVSELKGQFVREIFHCYTTQITCQH
jgi:hypothetical protein